MHQLIITIISLIIALQALTPLYVNAVEDLYSNDISNDCFENEVEELAEVELDKIFSRNISLTIVEVVNSILDSSSLNIIIEHYKDLSYPPPDLY